MIRIVQSRNAAHAKSYFKQGLEKSDYYISDQEEPGRFRGKLAARLGLGEAVTRDAFYALCDNKHPITGEKLTPRNVANRTVGWDVGFQIPKSASILHALSDDDHILEAFISAARGTMEEIEADCRTRIRTNRSSYQDRDTGELAWGEFFHHVARPVDGALPDPLLHCHCYVFNATWDDQEQKYKAAKFREIIKNRPFHQAAFHKRLADNLVALGYRIRKTPTAFELEGVPTKVIDAFSKRKFQVQRAAKEKGITDPAELDKLGARTRAKKQKGHTMAALKQDWRRQIHALGMSEDEGKEKIRFAGPQEPRAPVMDPQMVIDHAVLHCFERASVMSERNILREAYRYALGQPGITTQQIKDALAADPRIIRVREGHNVMCTTREVLAKEKHMVELAVSGKGVLSPLYTRLPVLQAIGPQADALRHILTTPDRVSIIRGAAGAGKTTMLKEAVALIEKTKRRVTIVAPSAEASRNTLRADGFENAETVARLLVDKKMQTDLEGQVLIVDEAGLLGTDSMIGLLDLATKKNARLLLVGDPLQHTSVVRGDALRILNNVAGIRPSEANRIHRQKNAEYREAVQFLADGRVKEAFGKLDKMDAIKTIDPDSPDNRLVTEYIETLRKGKSALVIAPTHKEGEKLTKGIRSRLRELKMLGREEITVPRLSNLNYTEAQKMDSRNYEGGQIIRFNQNVTGIKRGSAWTVRQVKGNQVEIVDDKQKALRLPLNLAQRFEVYERSEMDVSKGDKIRITREGFDNRKTRLSNGQTLEVLAVKKDGTIKVRNSVSKKNYSLPGNYGHIAHAHVVTSHASQGKTVDEVYIFFSECASSFGAANFKQFYVSVSRGRDRAHIYTDDKAELFLRVQETGDRQSALELVAKDEKEVDKMIDTIIRQTQPRQPNPATKDKPREKPAQEKIRTYEREPEI
ncbi:MobF family relaxase [Dawidia soli]|uniref:Relaxase domain-containing protein n=1 Tax=Dawidia soli TaxID=2782352 RepID=A0AAP2DDV9_9BACT|nr:MobF family relaxase [Dawidia soli]MBT1689874.1 relaxase domain-containing protein [Dawidia soli]